MTATRPTWRALCARERPLILPVAHDALSARLIARAGHGLDEALRRAERYLRAGADGVFVEAPQSLDELRRVGDAFRGVPQLANMLEGGRTPLVPPDELASMGFAMIGYPTSLLFRVARTVERALAAMKAGRLAELDDLAGFDEFKDIVGFAAWGEIEDRFAR